MFQALLTAYYLCDATAATTLMDYGTVVRCSLAYESAKSQFLTEEERAALAADPRSFRGEYDRLAYRRFTAWEDENADLVAEMKAGAAARVGAAPVGF